MLRQLKVQNMTIKSDSKYIRIKEARRMTGLSESTIYRALRAGQIAAFKRGKSTLIDRASFSAFVQARPWTPVTGYRNA